MTANRFSIPLGELAAKMKADVELIARKITFDAFSRVVQRSPVDTGRFRANWNISYGSHNYNTSESTDDGRIKSDLAGIAMSPVGGIAAICNGLPYAAKIEFGHSRQSPNGVVRITALEFSQSFGGINK